MQIKEMFAKKIDREIQGVIIVGQGEDSNVSQELEEYVVSIPDYPEKGIIFRDVTSILEDPEGLQLSIQELQDKLDGVDFNIVIGPESRGFIFGMPIAYNLQKAFVPIRKKGKLPCETASIKYDLEYGSAEIEIHKRSIKPGDKVVIVDDLMATGGTAKAIMEMVEEMGAEVVASAFLIELDFLNGRKALPDCRVEAVIHYE